MFAPVIPGNCLMESIPQSLYYVDPRAINGLKQQLKLWIFPEPSLRFSTFMDDVVIQYQGDALGPAIVEWPPNS